MTYKSTSLIFVIHDREIGDYCFETHKVENAGILNAFKGIPMLFFINAAQNNKVVQLNNIISGNSLTNYGFGIFVDVNVFSSKYENYFTSNVKFTKMSICSLGVVGGEVENERKITTSIELTNPKISSCIQLDNVSRKKMVQYYTDQSSEGDNALNKDTLSYINDYEDSNENTSTNRYDVWAILGKSDSIGYKTHHLINLGESIAGGGTLEAEISFC